MDPAVFARGAVKARRHAAGNLCAVFTEPLTVDEVLGSPHLFGPLTRLQPIAQNSRTAAVMSARQGTDVLASGGRDLSPAQRALGQGGDVLGRSPGAHAEITAMDAAGKAGLTPWQMAVSRPICPACQAAIEGSGGTVDSGGMFASWPW